MALTKHFVCYFQVGSAEANKGKARQVHLVENSPQNLSILRLQFLKIMLINYYHYYVFKNYMTTSGTLSKHTEWVRKTLLN